MSSSINNSYPNPFMNKKIYMIGIKGTGMTALAELLIAYGAHIEGSDSSEVFYTDAILARNGITPKIGFHSEHVTKDYNYIIYSAAYTLDNVEFKKTKELKLECYSYSQMLGLISQKTYSVGICGTHGKTSTTAFLAILLEASKLPASLILGSSVPQLENRASVYLGQDIFIAETCEYRRHFLDFFPNIIVLTSIDADHLDYFRDLNDVINAFYEYTLRLPINGILIYCNDDANVQSLTKKLQKERPDIQQIPYGLTPNNEYSITLESIHSGLQPFNFKNNVFYPNETFHLGIAGKHNVLNTTAALAVIECLFRYEEIECTPLIKKNMKNTLTDFKGATRRSQKIGTIQDITLIDDYGHHPLEIKNTLDGLRSFYKPKRLILDFMSHTYTRTEALFDDFCEALTQCDILLLHPVYGSARETIKNSNVGERMIAKMSTFHNLILHTPSSFEDAVTLLYSFIQPGDLVVSMGAGNNWQVTHQLWEKLKGKSLC